MFGNNPTIGMPGSVQPVIKQPNSNQLKNSLKQPMMGMMGSNPGMQSKKVL